MSEKSAVNTDRIKPNWRKAKQHEPSAGKAMGLQRELEKLESKYGVELTKVEPAGHDGLGQDMGGRSNEYPIRLFQRNPYDNVIELKAAANEKVFGKKMMTSEDLGKWQKANKIAGKL